MRAQFQLFSRFGDKVSGLVGVGFQYLLITVFVSLLTDPPSSSVSQINGWSRLPSWDLKESRPRTQRLSSRRFASNYSVIYQSSQTNNNCFLSRGAPRLSFPAWCKYLAELAAAKKMEVNIVKIKLINCGPPGVTDATVTAFLIKSWPVRNDQLTFTKSLRMREILVS